MTEPNVIGNNASHASGIFCEARHVLPYVKPYKYATIAGIIALLITDIGNMVIPYLMGLGIDGLESEATSSQFLLIVGGCIAGVALVRGLSRFGWRYYLIGSAFGIERDIRIHFYKHIIRLPLPFFARNRLGELLALSSNDLSAVRRAAGEGFMLFADFFFSFIGVLFFMINISPELTFYALLPTPFVTALFIYLGPILHRRFTEVQESFGDLTTDTEETLSGLRVVRSYNQEEAEYGRFQEGNNDYLQKNVRMIRIDAIFHSLMFIIPSMIFPMILVIGGLKITDGTLSIGNFIAFTMYIGQLVWPMMAIGWTFNIFQRGAASNVRVRSIFEESMEMPMDAIPQRATPPKVIEIRNLSFTYPGTETEILKDLNLTIPVGKTVALMGRTGSGKSTLISLITRLYDPPRGTIFYGGVDVLDIPLNDLRSQFATVPQDAFLFTETIRDNITFGTDAQLLSEHMPDEDEHEHLKSVSVGASLYNEILKMPDGYETVVGERGTMLSGGQRQRTAIARAFHARRNILILDDPLSAIDTVTETEILGYIRSAKEKRTLLLVTNRVNAALIADEIVIFDHGEISARGDEETLLKTSNFFAEIYQSQRAH